MRAGLDSGCYNLSYPVGQECTMILGAFFMAVFVDLEPGYPDVGLAVFEQSIIYIQYHLREYIYEIPEHV